MRLPKTVIVLLAVILLAGCGNAPSSAMNANQHANPTTRPQDLEGSKFETMVYTTKRELSLTFDGMADKGTMERILNELDKYGIKATFFLPGMRVAEEPDIANEIRARGHEIESNTLNREDVSQLTYAQILKDLKLSMGVIQQKTGTAPQYVRAVNGSSNEDLRVAAAVDGLDAVVGSSLYLHNWKSETDLQKRNYIRKYINRGGIIAIDTEENATIDASIDLIAKGARDVGYSFVTIDKLIHDGGERKPLEQIPGYDAARVNSDYGEAAYRVFVNKEGDTKKEVSLTFDDWGTDYTVTKILDTLDAYKVKASFFLRADGVEKNPNLARAIVEQGHDVANHTYSHPVITTVTSEALQEEIVKAHRIITEAIQEKPTMLFRPPTGDFDARTLKAVGATGYHDVAIFDVTPDDYVKSRSAAQIAQTVKEQTANGSVVLLHLLDDIQTIQALPIIIKELRSEGYTFVRMSELMGLPGTTAPS
ncbi:polysaccharide deacetylase family protein [Paenibacillus sacheonensis]|uniref:Polysaccharide deacetylase family protein n=1 Tax=Paenibacillus sacheonensis TaxID=742054 RepID=A0A7X5C321_9BACL|nr:polysaccharide deacetylase family protein [Paenibacillus sacheonensis]MBM7567117.1 peptidoglycan/xylan/chitin deacetylase (PgdA/CDA1 family) [Paenibacillus sacheonensis]NBC70954.1 polysaccharide deacetylase family protein [Paenibacillus sacheonensis]